MPPAIRQPFGLSPTQSELRGSPVSGVLPATVRFNQRFADLSLKDSQSLEETGHGCPVNQDRRSIKVPAFQAASEPAHKDLPDISVWHIEADVYIRTPCEIVHCGNLIASSLVSTKQTLKRITLAVLIPDEAATY